MVGPSQKQLNQLRVIPAAVGTGKKTAKRRIGEIFPVFSATIQQTDVGDE
jgi:hypothetical protein